MKSNNLIIISIMLVWVAYLYSTPQSIVIEWCKVPAGWFTMGSENSDAYDVESPVHNVLHR